MFQWWLFKKRAGHWKARKSLTLFGKPFGSINEVSMGPFINGQLAKQKEETMNLVLGKSNSHKFH